MRRLMLLFLLAMPAFAQTIEDEAAAAQHIAEASKLSSSEVTDTLSTLLGNEKDRTYTFYVVSQRGKELTLMNTVQGNSGAWIHLFITADCDTACKANMMPPEGQRIYATLERKHNGFWIFTKPAERKFKWTYWNVTSMSIL